MRILEELKDSYPYWEWLDLSWAADNMCPACFPLSLGLTVDDYKVVFIPKGNQELLYAFKTQAQAILFLNAISDILENS